MALLLIPSTFMEVMVRLSPLKKRPVGGRMVWWVLFLWRQCGVGSGSGCCVCACIGVFVVARAPSTLTWDNNRYFITSCEGSRGWCWFMLLYLCRGWCSTWFSLLYLCRHPSTLTWGNIFFHCLCISIQNFSHTDWPTWFCIIKRHRCTIIWTTANPHIAVNHTCALQVSVTLTAIIPSPSCACGALLLNMLGVFSCNAVDVWLNLITIVVPSLLPTILYSNVVLLYSLDTSACKPLLCSNNHVFLSWYAF